MLLLTGLQTAPLAAVIAAVVVELNLYIGLLKHSLVRQTELDVFDGQTAVKPLLLIIGTDGQYLVGKTGMIEVVCHEIDR